MSRALVFAAVVLALAAPGCTLLIDANQYVGNGGGHDAGPGNDSAVDAGPGHDSSVDTGPHANTPPVVGSLGLDQYRPMKGDTLHALASHVYDADGDSTSVSFQWFVNGSMQSGATTAALDTTGLANGDLVHVEAWANDGTVDGPHASTTDVTILEPSTRWRQLLPQDSDRLPLMVWDAANHRAVRYLDGGVWEYTPEGSNLRIQAIPTTGTAPPPDENAIAFFDEMRHRMIVYAVSDSANLYSLDLTHRGPSTWTRTSALGTGPSDLLLATAFYDPSTHHAYVVGGKDDTLGALFALYSLDLTNAGAEAWSSVTPSGDTMPPLFGTAVAPDLATPGRFYLLGGITSTMGSTAVDPVYSALDHVLQLDTTSSGVTVTQRTGTQPPFWGAVAGTTSTGHAIVYGGITAFGPGASLVSPQLYDIAGDSYAALPGTPPHGALLGVMGPEATSPDHFAALTIGASAFTTGGPSGLQFDEIAESGVTMVATRSSPASVVDAAVRIVGNAVQIYGGADGGDAATTAWSLDLGTLSWSPLVTTDDAATSHHPDFRYGVVNDASPLLGSGHLFQVGGARAVGVLADMTVFDLQFGGAWLEHTLSSGSAPTARTGHVVVAGTCGATRAWIYGGEDASGTPLGDGATLDCTSEHSCTWTTVAIDAGRSYPGVFSTDSLTYVFGGNTPSGPANDVLSISPCSGATLSAAAVTTTGTPPSPRFAGTLSVLADTTGASFVAYQFGGDDGTTRFADVTSLTIPSGPTNPSWATVTPAGTEAPRARAHHVAVPDATGHRIIVIGGDVTSPFGGYANGDDVWELAIRP